MVLKWKLFNEAVGDIPISDPDRYKEKMSLGYIDKLFFLNKINIDSVVDFGCADGYILNKIRQYDKESKLIGYDLDPSMIEDAIKKTNPSIIYTTNWDEVQEEIASTKAPALYLSSVIHEVYSYSSQMGVSDFWRNMVFSNDFKYIIIRDMTPPEMTADIDVDSFKEDVEKVRSKASKKYLSLFESKWGNIEDSYLTFLHFLLKYKYTDNWNRENNENYLPVTSEELLSKIPNTYSIIYKDLFTLPYLKTQIKYDFGIDIKVPTHIKLILKNNYFRGL